MTDTDPSVQPEQEIDLTLENPFPEYNIRHLVHILLLKRKVVMRANRNALRCQAKILLYIFKHDSLTAMKLRSMMNLSEITGFRYMGALAHCGLVKWKGSHKRGAYRLTEEGKKFMTDFALKDATYVPVRNDTKW